MDKHSQVFERVFFNCHAELVSVSHQKDNH